ncbi:MAG: right-handed parallel beta-helix repeat-containing protein [Nocardioides sp.]|nr:right-handed parallel beta-helix repeat-containing protein [Nocardioidaceae bacterium]MCB8956458.1 right-handed parallel beta-helix repeat-containing protein [Nocardioides sp.]
MTTLRAALLLAAAVALTGCSSDDAPGSAGPTAADCSSAPTVSDAGELHDALAGAGPGDVIVLADGEYRGSFTAAAAGNRADPVTLCGSRAARLVGASVDEGYTLHLDGASYWRVQGFTVSGGQKGVVLDDASHNVLRDLRVSGTGDEAVHLRAGSSDNLVAGNEVRDTGRHQPEYGEGIYVGSAQSNWCDVSECEPDRSDDNRIVGNDVRGTTAEAVDVKEGTTGGELRENVLGGGSGEVDSVVELKGNDWQVRGNDIATVGVDAVQVHVILDGWGQDNRITDNSFTLARPGYAVHLVGDAERAGNVVGCGQPVTPPGTGELSNVDCR